MSQCPPQARDLLSAYLDEEVTPAERRLVEQHLNECPDCRHQLERFESLVTLLSQTPVEPAPPNFVRGVARRIEEPGGSRRLRWRPWMSAAASVAALFIGVAIGLKLFHSEPPPAREVADLEVGYLRKQAPEMIGGLNKSLDDAQAPETSLRRMGYTAGAGVEQPLLDESTEFAGKALESNVRNEVVRSRSDDREALVESKAEGPERDNGIASFENEPNPGAIRDKARNLMENLSELFSPETTVPAANTALAFDSTLLDLSRRAVPVEPGLWICAVDPARGQAKVDLVKALETLGPEGVQMHWAGDTSLGFEIPAPPQPTWNFGLSSGEYVLATFPDARSFEQFSRTFSVHLEGLQGIDVQVHDLVAATAEAPDPRPTEGLTRTDTLQPSRDEGRARTVRSREAASSATRSATDSRERAKSNPPSGAGAPEAAGPATPESAGPSSPGSPTLGRSKSGARPADRAEFSEPGDTAARDQRPTESTAPKKETAPTERATPSSPPWLRLLFWFPGG